MSLIIPNPRTHELALWAQDHIFALENQIKAQQRAIDIFTGKRDSHVYWNDWLNFEYHNIPDSCPVKYETLSGIIVVAMQLDQEFISITKEEGALVVEQVASDCVKFK